MKRFATSILAVCMAFTAFAQLDTPAPSPTGTVTQKVGLTEVKIEYSRPSAKGRQIFGKVVMFGEVWRTGANASTKITFGEDCTIEGQKLAKGTYSLVSIPNQDSWEIIFSKNLKLFSGDEYKAEEDALRVKVGSIKLADKVETFTISTDNLTAGGCDVAIMWENTKVVFKVGFDTDAKVMENIKRVMGGPTAGNYSAAAQYYLDNGKDLNQALEWMNKSLEMGGEKYWLLRRKALIQAGLNDYKGAIETATRSLEMAKAEKNNDYVRMNEESIAEWSKKKK